MLTSKDDSHLNPPTYPILEEIAIDGDSVHAFAETIDDEALQDLVIDELSMDSDFRAALRAYTDTINFAGCIDNNQAKRDMIEAIDCALRTVTQRNIDDIRPATLTRDEWEADQ